MATRSEDVKPQTQVLYKTVKVGDVEIFYREAGPKDAPTILLLRGLPTSSQMFRNLILSSRQFSSGGVPDSACFKRKRDLLLRKLRLPHGPLLSGFAGWLWNEIRKLSPTMELDLRSRSTAGRHHITPNQNMGT